MYLIHSITKCLLTWSNATFRTSENSNMYVCLYKNILVSNRLQLMNEIWSGVCAPID